MVSAHIAVRWPKKPKHSRADYDCVVGEDIKINPAVLQDFSATLLTPVEQDLVLVVGAIAYADRLVRRHRSKGWARDLELTIPVSVPQVWKQTAVTSSLIDALEFVTGDRWRFHFVAGSQPMAVAQSALDYSQGNYVVVPFSDGLDSYLQWQLLRIDEPESNILRVHTSSSSTNWARNRRIDRVGERS